MTVVTLRGIRRALTALAVALALLLVFAAISFAGGKDKVGICHRTNSDTNPFVFLMVPADEANGHITGTHKSHNDQGRWKSDGVWQGKPHKAGDEKHDYFANSKADCTDGGEPSTTTTATHTTGTSTATSSTTSVPTTATTSVTTSKTTRPSPSTTRPVVIKPSSPSPSSTTGVPAPSSTTSAGPVSELPRTGASSALAFLGLFLIVVGVIAYYVSRNPK